MKIEKCLADLQLEVIYNDKCIKCGSCGAFCPNIYFEEGTMKFKEQCTETVGVCYNMCPRAVLNLPELDMKIFGKNRENMALGVFKKAVNAKLEDQSLKDVVTALLITALENNMIDSVVTGDASVEKRIEPVICKTKDEILNNAGERRGLGPIVWKTGAAIHEGNKAIAVVGHPCHIQGIAKTIKNPDFLVGQENIKLVISYFCLAQAKECNMCMDYTGEFSDISVDSKTGDMIIRSELGENLINKAIEAKRISISDIETTGIEEKAMKKKIKNFMKIIGKANNEIKAGYLQLDPSYLKEFL
ncbi:MAG: Coenzyme F420 hydrogenase/dehydrogenase, beta subunit C-terminal domain [Promethearchaeota archaeon]